MRNSLSFFTVYLLLHVTASRLVRCNSKNMESQKILSMAWNQCVINDGKSHEGWNLNGWPLVEFVAVWLCSLSVFLSTSCRTDSWVWLENLSTSDLIRKGEWNLHSLYLTPYIKVYQSYQFEMTWWRNDDRIFIFRWTYPLKLSIDQNIGLVTGFTVWDSSVCLLYFFSQNTRNYVTLIKISQ